MRIAECSMCGCSRVVVIKNPKIQDNENKLIVSFKNLCVPCLMSTCGVYDKVTSSFNKNKAYECIERDKA